MNREATIDRVAPAHKGSPRQSRAPAERPRACPAAASASAAATGAASSS